MSSSNRLTAVAGMLGERGRQAGRLQRLRRRLLAFLPYDLRPA